MDTIIDRQKCDSVKAQGGNKEANIVTINAKLLHTNFVDDTFIGGIHIFQTKLPLSKLRTFQTNLSRLLS